MLLARVIIYYVLLFSSFLFSKKSKNAKNKENWADAVGSSQGY
jgi:hypothetical protein